MNTPISENLQKLLIQKGIDMPVNTTISDVVMWLYGKHGIWVSVFNDDVNFFWMGIVLKTKERLCDGNAREFNYPTEAYENAIEYCLTKLI